MTDSSQAGSSQHQGEVQPPLQRREDNIFVTTTVKSNKIYATERDDWESVYAVDISEEKYSFRIQPIVMSCDIRLYPTRTINPSFELPSVRPLSVKSNRAAYIRCASVSLLAESPYMEVDPYVQQAAMARSDSDDEGPPDAEVPAVFSDRELYLLRAQHKEVYKKFFQACMARFQNAFGKLFFMEFCKFLLPHLDCLISTNPNGFYQPGSLCVEWVAPAVDGSGVVSVTQDRVADFVDVDQGVYTVVGEIKSQGTGGIYQNLEQMVGLLQKDQMVMLGLVVYPTKILPQMLVCCKKNITCYPLPSLPLKNCNLGRSLQQLAEMIVFFN